MTTGAASPDIGPAHAARAIAVGIVFTLIALLALLVGLGFCAGAAYLALLDRLEPRWAALAVGGGALFLALITALIGRSCVSSGARRVRVAIGASALVALGPTVLRFALRNARFVGLATTAAATFMALRGKRR